jgi:hypothetical protein
MSGKDKLRRCSELIVQRFTQLTAHTSWQHVDELKLNFRTYHPQGLVKIGDDFYVSSVEITTPPERSTSHEGQYDRTPGEGQGYVFKFDVSGNLTATINLGEGSMYHPGGIDFDGESIWVPVAEYRPNSQSIIYRVRPKTLKSERVFRFGDHLGALAYNRRHDTLHGASWGGRKFYTWKPAAQETWSDLKTIPEHTMHMNGSHYIDYQDCAFLEENYMLCSGLNSYEMPNVGHIALGGIELVDLDLQVAVHQIPVLLYSQKNRPMTQNPFTVELHNDRLRFYFLPDDHESILYIYDALT